MEDRRRVSVLFVDLVDFTPYAERQDPELVRGMQTSFFTAARQVIGQFGGVVEKYIGDAVMALFGAPVATENDALRCVRAGLELQRVLSRFASQAAGGLRYRVGVATGEAIVDVAAARNGGQAIVAGDVVNTASRLQAVAPLGGVLVCGSTYAATKDAIRYAAHAPVTLRGRSTPTEVWVAVAPALRARIDAEPDATPLIEREHELGLLVNALHRVLREHRPQLITLFGRAGLGKSRLVRELHRHVDRLTDEVISWYTGRCPPFGENVTYAALADVVKSAAGVLDTDDAPTARHRLQASLRELVTPAEAARLADALAPLAGLPAARLPADDAELAWRRFLIALAAQRPTVLLVEDLHWADEPMLRFVEQLAADAPDVPLLLVCTARPELVDHDPSWAGTITGSLTITLPPLRDSAIAKLYGHMFGQAAFPTQIDPLVEVAGGNPLYAHEYVRMLIDGGAMGGAPARSGEPALPMPESVHAVIANRVDLLDPGDRTVLQAAAVVGMHFWPAAVAAALGRPTESVERAMRRLSQREFVHKQAESTMAGQSEFRFRHVLVRDVCYQRLPRTERVVRHERTAEWLDNVGGGARDTDLAEVLAHHRWTAHEIARTLSAVTDAQAGAAAAALHRAARRAYSLHALDAAAAHLARALALFQPEHVPAEYTGELLRIELLAQEIAFYRDGATFIDGGGADRLHALADRLLDAGDPATAARAWTLLGQVAWLRTDRTAALTRLDRAVELFAALPDSPDKAEAVAELARLHMLNFERDASLAAAQAAAEIAGRLGLVEIQANARITKATARYLAGEPGGLVELRDATQYCRDHHLLALKRATQNLGYVMLEEGDWAGSDALLAESRPVDVPGGHNLATDYSFESTRAHYAGDWPGLIAAADAYLSAPVDQWDLQVRGGRAWIGVLCGDSVDVAADTDEVGTNLDLAKRSGFHRPMWTALATGSLCRALQGRMDEAGALLEELIDDWQPVPALAGCEWIDSAGFAAALVGADVSARLHAAMVSQPHQTPWIRATTHTTAAGMAAGRGEHALAGAEHERAAAIYATIPNVTDRMLAMALAAAGYARAGADERAEPLLTAVREFADRNRAPGLLRLAWPRG